MKMASMMTYITKLRNKYEAARAQYTALFDEYDRIKQAKAELQKKSREYTREGFEKRRKELDRQKEQVEQRLDAIPAEFKRNVAALREDVKAAFKGKYGVSPAKVDPNALALINSGALNDEEMTDLANQYKDNSTMLKLIGAKLKQSSNGYTAALGDVIMEKSRNTPHLEIYDSMAYVCENGLRVHERDHGLGCTPDEARAMSDGVHENLYPEKLENVMAAAAEITTD